MCAAGEVLLESVVSVTSICSIRLEGRVSLAIHVCALAEDGTAENWSYDTDDRSVWSVLDTGLRCIN